MGVVRTGTMPAVTVTPSDATQTSAADDAAAPGRGDPRPNGDSSDPDHGAARAEGGTGTDGDGPRRSWRRWFAVELHDDGPLPRTLTALVVLSVAVGVVLRFVTRSPLWLDEALSVNIASLPLGEIPEALRHDGHPPLYYALLHGWMTLFGTGDVAVRALSGIISVATLPFAYLAGRRVGGRLLGALALIVFALSPFTLRYATETRMYALVSLLVMVGYLLVDDIARRGRGGPARLIGLALVAAALLWSHYWALWLLGGLTVVLLWGWRRATRPEARRGSGQALAALVAGGVLFIPWLPSMLYQSAHTGTPWAGPLRPTAVAAITLTDFGGGSISSSFTEPQLFGGVMLVLILLALLGTARGMRRIDLDLCTVPQFRAEGAVVAATLVLALAVMYASRSAFASRYASVFLPLVLLLVAGGLSRLRDLRVLGGALAVVISLSLLGAAFNVRTDRSQAGVVAAQVSARAKPGDRVLYCPDQVAPAALRLMPPGLDHLAFPHLPGDPWPTARVDWVDYKARNGIDPRAYAHTVSADKPGQGLFVVFSGSYKTHEGTCENLVDELAKIRGNPEMLVMADGNTYFENAGLFYFGPPAPR
jgi:mannosyltransferase